MIDIPTGSVYVYSAMIYRVIDGDTWEVTVDLGFRVSARVMCRLHSYSCPELSDPGGADAANAVTRLLDGKKMLIRSYKDKRSFARWVVDAYVWTTEWVSVGEALVEGGFAIRNTL